MARKIALRGLLGLGALAVVAALVYFAGAPALIKWMSSGMPGGPRLVAGEGDYRGAESCAACHPTEFSQWSQSLHSRAATEAHFEPRFQQLSWGMTREQCLNCHSPSPTLAEGVSCEVCHGPADTRKVVKDVCLACHETPGEGTQAMMSTPAEFLESTAHREGKGCVDCHMRDPSGEVYHAFPGSRAAPDVYRGVAAIETIEQRRGRLLVTVRNKVTGHYLPTGAPENILFLEITGYDGQGEVAFEEEIRFEKRAYWFRNMPIWVRSDNRLRDGELREFVYYPPRPLSRVKATLKIKPVLWNGERADTDVYSRERTFPSP
ncbi:MAG: multiheme c-type cytochrome [Dehalococcoidia bacterium]